MGNLWKMHRKPMGNAWEIYGKSIGHLWEMRGKPIGNLWEIHGKSMETSMGLLWGWWEVCNRDIEYIYIYMSFYNIWLVVGPPLWKIWKSIGIIIPNICKNKKCSKPPTRYSVWQRGTPMTQETSRNLHIMWIITIISLYISISRFYHYNVIVHICHCINIISA